MLISTRNTIATSCDLEIFLGGELLKHTISVKYLGVHIDRNLSWNMHVNLISCRVYPRLKLLNRTFNDVVGVTILKLNLTVEELD